MIPFVDLKAQYQSIKQEIDQAVLAVLGSSQFVLGKYVQEFEERFAAYCQTQYAIGVNSGTSALHLALLAAGIGSGDEVITIPFTFVATAAAVHYTGARPVYVDVDPATFTMDPGQIERAITERTKAILPVHLYGHPADMDPILEIARRHKLIVIEDAAQAHGAEYKGRRVGSVGDLGCFSFYPGKNLGAYGEGGAVVTSNPEYTRKIRMLRDWGAEKKYHHELRGFNYRLEGIQGAILGVKLTHLERWTEARRLHAALYTKLLAGSAVVPPPEAPGVRHVYHVYAVRCHGREQLTAALNSRGVQTGIHYPIPVHLQDAYRDPQFPAGSFPHSERAANEVVSLPMFAELTNAEIEQAAAAVRETAETAAQRSAGR